MVSLLWTLGIWAVALLIIARGNLHELVYRKQSGWAIERIAMVLVLLGSFTNAARASADEVLADLREITLGRPDQALFANARMDGPLGFTLIGAPTEAEATLRELIATKSEESRGLKAIQTIEPTDGGVRVTLHPFEEPPLKEIAPGLQAACHLVE